LQALFQVGVGVDQGDGLGADALDALIVAADHVLEFGAQERRAGLFAGQGVQAIAGGHAGFGQLHQETSVVAQLQPVLPGRLPRLEGHALQAFQQHRRVQLVGLVALVERLGKWCATRGLTTMTSAPNSCASIATSR
jgi:hypothetical protein